MRTYVSGESCTFINKPENKILCIIEASLLIKGDAGRSIKSFMDANPRIYKKLMKGLNFKGSCCEIVGVPAKSRLPYFKILLKATGIANPHPEDEFIEEIGKRVAHDRARLHLHKSVSVIARILIEEVSNALEYPILRVMKNNIRKNVEIGRQFNKKYRSK